MPKSPHHIISHQSIPTQQIKKWIAGQDDKEIARGTIVIIKNDLHDAPYALVEDVFTDPAHRGQGLFGLIMDALIEEAKRLGCYKIIATSRASRPKVHESYKKLGFTDYGKEFRLDLP